jgi:hypothetical protein
MNSGKIGLNYFMNQMFSEFGLSTTTRIIVIDQPVQKENINEQSRGITKENQGLGA